MGITEALGILFIASMLAATCKILWEVWLEEKP